MRLLLISLLVLLIATATVQAAIPTPPLADDPSLVLRFSFEDRNEGGGYLHFSWESDMEGWSASTYYGTTPERSTDWASDGSYSIKITGHYDTGTNYDRWAKISRSINRYVDKMTFDIKITSCSSAHPARVKINGNVVWSSSEVGEHSVEITVNDSVDTVEIGTWTLYEDDDYSCTFYVDNVKFVDVVEDDSGNGNDGIVYGATSVEGRYGYGLSFDGDYVSVPDSSTLGVFDNGLTVAFWAYPEKSNAVQYVVDKFNGHRIRVFIRSFNAWGFSLIGSSGSVDNSGPSVKFNEWSFIVMTYDNSTKEAKFYVNGELKRTVSKDVGTIDVSGVALKIGCEQGNKYFFGGIIDEVRIYNRSLSDSEIKSMYEALRVKFYDESSGEKIAANATVFNANYSIDLTTDEVTKEAVLFNADLPAPGNYILQASSSNYYTRNFFVNLSGSYQEKEYLLLSKSADAVLINFKLNDPTGIFDKPVLIITKTGSSKEVTSDYFDVEQKVPATLMFNSRYFTTVIDAESSTERKIGEFIASSSGDKYINVYSNIVPHSPFLDFTYDIYDANNSIVVQYNDTTKQTEYINVRIYNSTGYLVYNDTAAANDYALTYIKPNLNETYKVVLHIKRVDQEILETRFLTGPDVAINIKSLIPPKEITGLDQDVALALACLVIIILIAGLFSKKHSRLGALAVAFISAGLWFWGWLPIDQTIIISLLIIAVLAKFEEGYKGG